MPRGPIGISAQSSGFHAFWGATCFKNVAPELVSESQSNNVVLFD